MMTCPSAQLSHLHITDSHLLTILSLPYSSDVLTEMIRRLYRNEAGIKNEFQEAKIVGAK